MVQRIARLFPTDEEIELMEAEEAARLKVEATLPFFPRQIKRMMREMMERREQNRWRRMLRKARKNFKRCAANYYINR